MSFTNIYAQQFENRDKLIEQKIQAIFFYLDENDFDFTEQPNEFGKSLFNGIDIKTENDIFSIGNRFVDFRNGLSMDVGSTNNFEFIDDEKKPVAFNTTIIGQSIKSINIFWMENPWEDATTLYPQEIEILTDDGYLLISSIEINEGQVNTACTDELLIIDKKDIARNLKLGQFGVENNGRKFFQNMEHLLIDK